MRIAIQLGIAFCLVTYTVMMFLPVWVDIIHLPYANDYLGIINIVSDAYLVCLPILAVARLQLPLRKKIGVILIFLSGAL